MTVLIDTTQVPPNERLDYWATASSELFMPLEVAGVTGRPFRGSVLGHELGAVSVYRVSCDPSAVLRTPVRIRAADPEQYFLFVHLSGHCAVEQDDRWAVLGVGDMTSCHSSDPFVIRHDRPVEALAFAFPRSTFQPYTDRMCRETATRIAGSEGLGRLVSPFLRQLADSLDQELLDNPSAALSEGVLSLVRGLYSGRIAVSDAGVPGSLLLQRIKVFVEQRLGDATLSPEQIASSHAISTRYLYKLFEAEGVGVREWIRIQRLDRCRRDLGDARLCDESVFRIAVRWGFTNQAHFSRLFRTTYSCSPREFRRASATGQISTRAPTRSRSR